MFKKLNLYKFLLLFSLFVNASNDEKNSLIEIYDNPNDANLINIVIKDNIDIAGKVTSAGSLALKDNIADKDAFIIDKLKSANYYILGKANLSEWANFRSQDSVSGWSSLGGQTKHFIDDAYNPCGSSSGSAVAVSMGIVDIAIGTETNGSISCPSSVNGIVGFKPTTGLVSRSGIIPISSSQDTAGPMGATVDIVAKTLEVISGYDVNDPATSLIQLILIFIFQAQQRIFLLKVFD
jgi:Asp-tRNAAsn/Glu-tRNAGln amidotransferase A subunit and related amidases